MTTRARFGEWARARYGFTNFDLHDVTVDDHERYGTYVNPLVQHRWEGFQAASEPVGVCVAESALVTHVGPHRYRVADSEVLFVSYRDSVGEFCGKRVRVIVVPVEE